MLLSLFLVLLGICTLLVALGSAKNDSGFSIVGFIFLFVLSTTILMPTNLDHKIGESTNTTHTYSNGTLVATAAVQSDVYQNYPTSSTRWFGIYLALLAVIGSTLELMSWKKSGED